MAKLTFNGTTYTVDHAVKGTDYVHGFDANGVCVVAIEGISNFSGITYNGTYMNPSACADESCNDVKYYGGKFHTRDGSEVSAHIATTVVLPAASWSSLTQTVNVSNVTADNTVIVCSHPDNHLTYQESNIRCTGQAQGALTFKCSKTPTGSVKVNVLILK